MDILHGDNVSEEVAVFERSFPDLVLGQPGQVIPVTGDPIGSPVPLPAVALVMGQGRLLPEGPCSREHVDGGKRKLHFLGTEEVGHVRSDHVGLAWNHTVAGPELDLDPLGEIAAFLVKELG